MAKLSDFNKGYEAFMAKGGSEYDGEMKQIAENLGINYDLWHKQVYLESSFNPKAVSSANARGLGQFVPATGKAYGLETEEDFFNPSKSLMASATHFKELVDTYQGDELKALLAYNQGQGRVGKGSLEAYDSGDYSKIREEGYNYMKLLGSSARNGRADFLAFAGVSGTPPAKTEGDTAPRVENTVSFGTLEPDTKDWQGAYGQGLRASNRKNNFDLQYNLTGESKTYHVPLGLGGEGGVAPVRDHSIREEYYHKQGRETADGSYGAFENIGTVAKESLKTSTIGAAITMYEGRPDLEGSGGMAMLNNMFDTAENPTSNWEPEDYERWRDAGVQPSSYHLISRGTREQEAEAIRLALEMQESRTKMSQAGLGAQIGGGFAGALGDPLSYTPMVAARGASLTARLAWGAAAGGAAGAGSEYLNVSATGGESDYLMAVGVGSVLGSVINGISHRALKKQEEGTPDGVEELTITQGRDGRDFNGYVEETALQQQIRLENEALNIQDGIDPLGANRQSVDLEGRPTGEFEGTNYTILDETNGTVITAEGAIMDGANPYNPESAKRAQAGIPLGKYDTVSQYVSRSEHTPILDVANSFFRATAGYQDGSSGLKRMVVSDVKSLLSDRDNYSLMLLQKAREEAAEASLFSARKNIGNSAYDAMDRRVVEAIESNDYSKLSRKERVYAEGVRDFTDAKMRDMANPAKYGNIDAPAVLTDSRFVGRYFPVVYDGSAIELLVKKHGRAELEDALARSYLESYHMKADVRARVDKYLKEQDPDLVDLNQAVRDYAKSVAAGVAGDKANLKMRSNNLAADTEVTGLANIKQNNYTESRHAFDNNAEVQLNGESFSPNDLRVFNTGRVLPAYSRRVTGDVAIHAGTGKSTADVVDHLDALKQQFASDGKALKQVDALGGFLKSITGRSRADKAEGTGSALIRSLNNAAYIGKHAYFAMQNFGEVAAMVTKGHLKMLMHNVPVMKHWATLGKNAKIDDLKAMHTALHGMELNTLIRPSKEDTIMAIRNAGGSDWGSRIAGNLKYATQELSARLPLSRALPATQNLIVDSARMGVLSDMVEHALTGAKPKMRFNFLKKGLLNSMGVDDKQLQDVLQMLRDNFKKQPDGTYKLVDPQAIVNDPRSLDLWRIGDWAAGEAVVRTERVGAMSAGHMNPFEAMAFQFKQFTLNTLNSRTVRGFNEAFRNGRGVDQLMTAVISTGLATMTYMAQRYANSLSMQPEARAEFLEKSFDPWMLAYAAASRSSHLGAIPSVANYGLAATGNDMARAVRTSILPEYAQTDKTRTDAMQGNPMQDSRTIQLFQGVAEQVPSLGTLASIYQIGVNSYEGGRKDSMPTSYRTGIWNGFRNLIPNDPASQYLLNSLAWEVGVEADL